MLASEMQINAICEPASDFEGWGLEKALEGALVCFLKGQCTIKGASQSQRDN